MKKNNEDQIISMMENDQNELIWVREITPPTAESFVSKIFAQSAEDPSRPIVIYIDSPGGYVDSLMSMLSALDFVPNPIITVAMGEAASCGAVLLSHGDVRFASPYSRVMVHEAMGGGVGNIHDAKNQVAELEYANSRIIGILAANCGKTPEQIQNLISHVRRDVYMSAQEAVEIGLVDVVGVPTVAEEVAYNVVVATAPPTTRRGKRYAPLTPKKKLGKKKK